MKRFFKENWLVIVTGIVVGTAALLLQALGNPKNMGFCIACFERDIVGAVGLHSVDLQFHCKGFSKPKINEMRYFNMKIKVCGKAHLEGVAKKTGRPYNFNQIHYLGKARGVIGEAALTLALDPDTYPLDLIEVGKEYNVDFDNRGYVFDFSPAK